MRSYIREIIIVSLVLIILSLILIILLESDVAINKILDFKTVVLSLSTFGGAALGAMLAGRYAVSSVEKQIESNNIKEQRDKHDIFLKIYMQHKPRFELALSEMNSLIDKIEYFKKEGIKSDKGLIAEIKQLEEKLIRFNEDIGHYNINELSFDFYKDIHVSRTILEQQPILLSKIQNIIYLGGVEFEVNFGYLKINAENFQESFNRLNDLQKMSERNLKEMN